MTAITRGLVVTELAKLPAFLRRDFLVAWSYRMTFVTDAISLVTQILVFSFVGRIVDESTLPRYGPGETDYVAFVTTGIALTAFLQVGLARMTNAIRTEQLMGTLEALFMTPTSTATLQLGAVAYDLVYVPLRTGLFLALVSAIAGVHIHVGGVLPAAVMLVAFVPLVWGLGIASAAGVLTFRRGSGLFGIAAFGLTFTSGAYFPVDVFPGWVETLARYNPIAIALDDVRAALLGGAGWSELGGDVVILAVAAPASVIAGMFVFNLALRRERRLGTLGQY